MVLVYTSFLALLLKARVAWAYHDTIKGDYPYPEQRCGCARAIQSATVKNCEHNECLSTDPDYCNGGYYGCSKTPGMCPLPGGYRNGYCHEPYGTHKVCADTNKEVLDWFKTVGNDLSSVVAPGMGWCLCKHWTRGAICCHLGEEGMLEGAINFRASDLLDPDVQQIQKYIDGEISKKEFCCDPRYPLSGCTPDVCKEPTKKDLMEKIDEQRPKPEESPRVPANTDCKDPVKKTVNGVTPWTGSKPQDFFNEYNNVFKTNNRNAASHLWASFLLLRSTNLTANQFEKLFGSFCPVSGSIVYQSAQKRYGVPLKNIRGEEHFGYLYFCCWPCVCDSKDFIRTDTKTVTVKTNNGKLVEKEYMFTVISNPCEDESELERKWVEPFRGRTTSLKESAPELKCETDADTGKRRLVGAILSDHGYPIIGMHHNPVKITEANREQFKCTEANSDLPGRMTAAADGKTMYNSHCELNAQCAARAKTDYASGMGQIFRRVSEIGKFHAACPVKETGEDFADGTVSKCNKYDGRRVKCNNEVGCMYKLKTCIEKPEAGACEIRENKKARGGKRVTVGKAKTACECHDLCKKANKYAAYQLQRPKTKKNGKVKPGRCSCYAGKNGKVRFPAKEDARYISGALSLA